MTLLDAKFKEVSDGLATTFTIVQRPIIDIHADKLICKLHIKTATIT